MNVVSLIGRLTKDPELKTTATGLSVCTISVAVQRTYKNKQTGEYDADFITVVAWDTRAEFISRYFRKGTRIGVTGRLQSRTYDDKNGTKHWVIEIIADNVEFADGKEGGGNQTNAAPPPPANPAPAANNSAAANKENANFANVPDVDNDDYPF